MIHIRLWDKKGKRWSSIGQIPENEWNSNNYNVSVFTGLKDRSNFDIYTYDILRCSDTIFVIAFYIQEGMRIRHEKNKVFGFISQIP